MHIRKCARVVLLNDRDEVFMFRHTDDRHTYWVLPGGGVEEGETWEEAAIREMWEETGISGIPLGPWLWTRRGMNRVGGTPWTGDERYYLVRCGLLDVSNANQLDYEKEVYTVSRWWSVEHILASGDIFWPDGLAHLLEPIIAGSLPARPIHLPE